MFKFLLIGLLLLGPPKIVRVALSVSPHFIPLQEAAGKGVKATLTIEPDDRNREACLVWESDNEVGDHCWEFNEIPMKRTTEVYIRLHSLGTYDFVLVLQGTDKRIQTPPQIIEVS